MANLLVVENDSMFREITREILSAAGHDVRAVSSGEAGMAAIEEDPPAMVITNLMIGGMTGPEFMSAVRDRPEWRSIPFMLVSTTLPTDIQIHAETFGERVFIHRPLDGDVLHKAVTEALHKF